MQENDVFDLYMNEMQELAGQAYKETPEYRQVLEALEQARLVCMQRLVEQGADAVEECMELMWDATEGEAAFLYRKGYLDCVHLLKRLQVL